MVYVCRLCTNVSIRCRSVNARVIAGEDCVVHIVLAIQLRLSW